MAAAKIETQAYRVVYSEKSFEIRYYPSAILATVYSKARSYRDLSVWGFRKLAGYIFGGNASDTSIAMTSPVHMDINDTRSSMSFVMPSTYAMEKLPKPRNSEIVLETMDDQYLASLRFGGYASDRKIKQYSDRLKHFLEAKGIACHGNFRYLGYNPPYQFWGRRNEVVVSVTWKE